MAEAQVHFPSNGVEHDVRKIAEMAKRPMAFAVLERFAGCVSIFRRMWVNHGQCRIEESLAAEYPASLKLATAAAVNCSSSWNSVSSWLLKLKQVWPCICAFSFLDIPSCSLRFA